MLVVPSQDVQFVPVTEQVAHTELQAIQVELTESQYLVVTHPQKPVELIILCVADGQVKQAVLEVQVAQDE